jgi:hypothetical protein
MTAATVAQAGVAGLVATVATVAMGDTDDVMRVRARRVVLPASLRLSFARALAVGVGRLLLLKMVDRILLVLTRSVGCFAKLPLYLDGL